MINPKAPLKLLAEQIDWHYFEKEFANLYKNGPAQPPKSIRLMIGLLMLQHIAGISDQKVVETGAENPYWQYFCADDHFHWKVPVDASSLVRWPQRLGPQGMEKILAVTIQQAINKGVIKKRDWEKVIVDTTVMEKNIAYPTDSNLLNTARQKLVKLAKKYGLKLRQNYNRVANRVARMVGGYAHAKQYKRMRGSVKKLGT